MKRLLLIGSLLALAVIFKPTPTQAQSCINVSNACTPSTQAACTSPSAFSTQTCDNFPGTCIRNTDQSCTNSTWGSCTSAGSRFVPNATCPTSAGSTTTTPPATTQSSQKVELPNPIACNDATCLIGQVVRYILGSIAVVATLMFVWGGVMMLTSGGNADQVKRAKETLVWAAIGVVVILLSWVIIKAVLQALTKTSS